MDAPAWKQRLHAAIRDRWVANGGSLAELSRQAGQGSNYVSQMLNEDKEPKTQAVINIAQVLNVSLSWIFLGIEMTAEDEKLLLIAAKIDTNQKKKLLDLLGSISSEIA